jgi:cell division protein FtsW
MILLFRGIKILRDNDKPFGGLMAIGLTFSLVFQAMVNMAVAVNLFPVTGQPLPLISMGGTSMIFTMITLGIILSVSKTKNEEVVENLEAV